MLAEKADLRMTTSDAHVRPPISAAAGEARPLDGRVALVTGSGRGIGRAEALRLAAYGATVVVNDLGVAADGTDLGETPAEETVREIVEAGGEAVVDTSDISTTDGGEAVVQRALDGWGRLDIVVNNAGIGRPRMVFNLAPDEWDDVVRVHLRGTFAVTAPAARWWRSESKAGRGGFGRVINTSTGLLPLGGAGQSNYVAAKAGILAFSEAIATELAPYGVTVNTILPGALTRLAAVGWRMARTATEDTPFDATSPVHVAELVCYLASPDAGWLSGQAFQVSGGRINHLLTFVPAETLQRADRGWTVGDLRAELPRLFGAGPRASDPPPPEWSDRSHARGPSVTAP